MIEVNFLSLFLASYLCKSVSSFRIIFIWVLIIGLIALSFESSFYLFFPFFFLFSFSSPWKCVNLFEWSCAIKSYFTISLGILSSMLCGLWNLDGCRQGWAWDPRGGETQLQDFGPLENPNPIGL